MSSAPGTVSSARGSPRWPNFRRHVFSQNGYRTECSASGIWATTTLSPAGPRLPGDTDLPWLGAYVGETYWNTSYYDDHYLHNGKLQQYKGYCTDVWFREAKVWIKSCAARHEPFFVYLPTNAPHGPLWVPEKYVQPYQGKVPPEMSHFFGMIANIDENLGRLDAMLKELGLYDNTILVFMTDNGGTAGRAGFGMPACAGTRPSTMTADTGCLALCAGRPGDCGSPETSANRRSARTCCQR